MVGGSPKRGLQNVTWYGSKMGHRSVTGVTCDTTRHGLSQCPPFRAEPMEAKKKATGKEYTCRKEIPFLEQNLEKEREVRKSKKNSTKILQVQSKVKKKILECLSKGVGTQDS